MTKAQILEKIDAEIEAYKPFVFAIRVLAEARDTVAKRRTDASVVEYASNALAIARGVREGR